MSSKKKIPLLVRGWASLVMSNSDPLDRFFYPTLTLMIDTVKPVLRNRQNKDLNAKWYLNEGQKYCRMLQAFCNTFALH